MKHNGSTRERVPAHLRKYVVWQDYDCYDEVDQAVWRFVLLQTYARLRETAHPAYVDGLFSTGISVERIPRISDMDACLSQYGWGAVAVDGFIPPRVFQEFQALEIMTIAVEIRRPENLAYTPAPDIIHESAGHSPIIPDALYRSYLKQFGEIGKKAFGRSKDARLYAAIHRLSELKENRGSTAKEILEAETLLAQVQAEESAPSEAALLSRLHWWTVEYGLVGTPHAYKIYGAGLLSSLGESHFCHDPHIAKIPLSPSCIDIGYDITKPQPQLFVARDFGHLQDVLDEISEQLAQKKGGSFALERAKDSGEIATVVLNSGLEITGVVEEFWHDKNAICWLRLSGACALSYQGKILPRHDSARYDNGFVTPLGRLRDGTQVSRLSTTELNRWTQQDGRLCFSFPQGVQVRGEVIGKDLDEEGRLLCITLNRWEVSGGETRIAKSPTLTLAVGESVVSCYAGPADPSYWPKSDFANVKVPRPKEHPGMQGGLLTLYERALAAWNSSDKTDLVRIFHPLVDTLESKYPNDWLLRWNLLECLCKRGVDDPLVDRLRNSLLAIEERFPNTAPVSLGLRYLGMVP